MAPRQVSDRFQKQDKLFRIGDRTANQANSLISMAIELLDQVTGQSLLSRYSKLGQSQLATIKSSLEEAFTLLNQVERQLSASQDAYGGLSGPPT